MSTIGVTQMTSQDGSIQGCRYSLVDTSVVVAVESVGGNGEYSKTQGGREFSCSPDKSGFLVLVSILKETSSGPSRFYTGFQPRWTKGLCLACNHCRRIGLVPETLSPGSSEQSAN